MVKLTSKEKVGDKHVILLNQENFPLKANTYKLLQYIPNLHFFFNPAVKIAQHKGRQVNGMSIYVSEYIKNHVTGVCLGHQRVKAIVSKNPDKKILIINIYLLVERNINVFNTDRNDGNNELIETITVRDNILEKIDCDTLILAGYINCDFSRSTRHTSKIRNSLFD